MEKKIKCWSHPLTTDEMGGLSEHNKDHPFYEFSKAMRKYMEERFKKVREMQKSCEPGEFVKLERDGKGELFIRKYKEDHKKRRTKCINILFKSYYESTHYPYLTNKNIEDFTMGRIYKSEYLVDNYNGYIMFYDILPDIKKGLGDYREKYKKYFERREKQWRKKYNEQL